MYAQEILASRFVELCHGVVVSEISPYFTRTPYFLKTSLTAFFFSPLAVHTRYFSCVAVTNRDWPNFVECCSSLSTCAINSVYLSRGGIESVYMIFFLVRQWKSDWNRDISAVMLKIHPCIFSVSSDTVAWVAVRCCAVRCLSLPK